ncbi:MAG TPA: ABC-F family ATP-binding cassette domain-containing protein [Clostridia bacterium]|nr:ABC-F family ATP-binding cassette domain-containing protein [Clostridia bacterium]
MAVLSANNLEMGFGEKTLLNKVGFMIENRDKVGLVGANGTGKTTLFKLIIGELEPVGGEIVKSKDTIVGYVEQHACGGSQKTLYYEMESVFAPLIQIEHELEELADKIHTGQGNLKEMINRQSYLQEDFERKDDLTYKSRTRSALLGLGFNESDFDLHCDKLSGGQRSKLSLGKLLLSGANLLLLDEPTNHLDIKSIEWLEGFLSEYKGAALIISHERYFLDRITTKTMEINYCRLTQWNGNYSEYLKQKEINKELEQRHYENKKSEIEHIEKIIEQQKRWGRERNFKTVASKQKMLDKKLQDLEKPESEEDTLEFSFKPFCVSGNDVLDVKGLSKAFDENVLFENVSFKLKRNERAFLLGANGCGKTTLLRIITKEQRADNGSFSLGANVKIGYFDQTLSGLNDTKTVIDEIWDTHRGMNATQVRSALAAFLFKGDDVFKRISDLSGGEKARVALLKLMLSGANFLLLDEPTNHLDITSMEALENALLDFDGTMLIVSHDRYFINKIATEIYSLQPDGVEKYAGGYDSYLESVENNNSATGRNNNKKPKVSEYKLRLERAGEMRKLEGKIKRCEKTIDELDERISELNTQLQMPEITDDYIRILELTTEIDDLQSSQDKILNEWEELFKIINTLREGDDNYD